MAPILRRRADAADRLGLEVAFRLAPAGDSVPTVFASRHGQITRSASMLKAQTEGVPASPTDFSLSVHNAAAGQFSIAKDDRSMSTSLSGRGESFAAALLEGLGLVAEGHPRVLVVMSDLAPPQVFQGRWDGEPAGYSLGLLLGAMIGKDPGDGGTAVNGGSFTFSLRESRDGGKSDGADTEPPQALMFLKLLAGKGERTAWERRGRRWEWART